MDVDQVTAPGSGSDRSAEPVDERDRFATAGERVAAYLVDAGVVVGALLALTRRWGPARRLATLVLGSLVCATGYHVLLEGSRGQTVGKRVLGVAVVRTDGEPCGYRPAAVRTVARALDFLPVGYLLGLCSIRLTERRQRVGDLAAGTVVVETGTTSGAVQD